MGYWNAEWEALRDKGCICQCLNYDVDNRTDNPTCPYHHPEYEPEDIMDDKGTYLAGKLADRGYPGVSHASIAGIGNQLPNLFPGGDFSKPHQYIGPAGIYGGACLMCGAPAAAPIHTIEPKPLPEGEIRVQAIEDNVAGNVIRIEIDNAPTQEARDILLVHLPKVLEHWLRKNKDYGDSDELKCLGARAEFVRLWNKVMKLKRNLWDGEPLHGEQTDEIMGDMIAHLLLALNRS